MWVQCMTMCDVPRERGGAEAAASTHGPGSASASKAPRTSGEVTRVKFAGLPRKPNFILVIQMAAEGSRVTKVFHFQPVTL